MSLVTSREMLESARREGYAVPAFNVENMEMIQAVLATAAELYSPVILQTTPSTLKYAGADLMKVMVTEVAQAYSIPVTLHLDHGNSIDLVIKALRAGFTSIMIDGSPLPFSENIALTQKVVQIAKVVDIPVEAELGKVGGKEDNVEVNDEEAVYTDPLKAKEFVASTGIHSLAIAIGTAHGFYKGEPKLDFSRLEKIRNEVEACLVLHGASGVPDAAVQKAIKLGICKVNFATELRAAMTRGVREALKDEHTFDPKVYLSLGKKAVQEIVKKKILLCGSDHRV
ncbi:MAG TPA: tagatose-bisphosphate aldolase subunit GatY [Bacillota bacterium]